MVFLQNCSYKKECKSQLNYHFSCLVKRWVMFKHDSIADFQNWINLFKSARQEKNVGIVRVKVDLQTKCTITVVVADVVILIITFISQETISNSLHVSMN